MKDDGEVERIIHYFKGTDEVSTLYIFGSLGKGKKTGESDIDIAVLTQCSPFSSIPNW